MKPRKQRVFELSKGFRNRGNNCFSLAKRKTDKAAQYQYVSRKLRKREYRKISIIRISAATREYSETNNSPLLSSLTPPSQSQKLNYSTFVHGLAQCNIELNRKMLAEIAVSEPFSFVCLLKEVQRQTSSTRATLFKNTEDTEDSLSSDPEEWPDPYMWAFDRLTPEQQEEAFQFLNLKRRIRELGQDEELIPLEDYPEAGPETRKWLQATSDKPIDTSIQAKLSQTFDTPYTPPPGFMDPTVPPEVMQELKDQKAGLKGISWKQRFREFEEESKQRSKMAEQKLKNQKRE